jgi:hypothetical protein
MHGKRVPPHSPMQMPGQIVFAAYDTAGYNVKECIGVCHLLTALHFVLILYQL